MKKIRVKRNFLFFFIFPVGFFSILFLIGPENWIWFPVVVIFIIIILLIGKSIKCPNCSRPAGLQKYKIGSIEFVMETVFTKRQCDFCGYPFV